jgi:hypothetical protein
MYWIHSTAPYAVLGKFNSTKTGCDISPCALLEGFNTDSHEGIISLPFEAITCNIGWLAVALVASTLLLVLALASFLLNFIRRGPDLLDSFGTLLKDSKYIDLPASPSLEDASLRSRSLKDAVVLFGDGRPQAETGYAAFAVKEGRESSRGSSMEGLTNDLIWIRSDHGSVYG